MWSTHRARYRWRLVRAGVAALAAGCVLAACANIGSSAAAPGASSGAPVRGGSLTVLEDVPYNTEMSTLDPVGVTGGIIYSGYLSAIFDQLFWLGPNGQDVPGLATGYSFADGGKELVIQLRHGVTFSDGTPFNAAAVVWNFQRDAKEGAAGCGCVPPVVYDPHTTFTASGDYTVLVRTDQPIAVGVLDFQEEMWNYIVSPTAYNKMGAAAFASDPVGAGPFTVESFSPNDKLVLKRNPGYYDKGHPYLDTLTFTMVSDAQTALQAMEAGEGDVLQDLSQPGLVSSFQPTYRTLANEASTPTAVQFNTLKPPFSDITAREVLYYATNVELLNKELFGNANTLTQSFAPPGTRFAMPTVPGTRTYNLATAQALVKQLGGLSMTLSYLTGADDDLAKALQTEWQAAGVKVTLDPQDNSRYFESLQSKSYQVYLNLIGGYDPAAGSVPAYFTSASDYSAVHDTQLNQLINAANATIDQSKRAQAYKEAAELISSKAYALFLMGQTIYTASVKSVTGPGISTPLPAAGVIPLIWWQDVSIQ